MWPDSHETQELLLQAQAGDRVAVERLLDRHREALRRMIELRMDQQIERRVDASDIVQDVLIDANRRLPEYLQSHDMPFHLWLRHIAKDRLIDAHRRHRSTARRSVNREQSLNTASYADESALDLAARLRDNRELTPATAATRRELQERFRAAVELLDEHDREVILMRHFEHLTNQEVARALDISEPTAGMRYLRAVRRLRKLLNDTEGES